MEWNRVKILEIATQSKILFLYLQCMNAIAFKAQIECHKREEDLRKKSHQMQ